MITYFYSPEIVRKCGEEDIIEKTIAVSKLNKFLHSEVNQLIQLFSELITKGDRHTQTHGN